MWELLACTLLKFHVQKLDYDKPGTQTSISKLESCKNTFENLAREGEADDFQRHKGELNFSHP